MHKKILILTAILATISNGIEKGDREFSGEFTFIKQYPGPSAFQLGFTPGYYLTDKLSVGFNATVGTQFSSRDFRQYIDMGPVISLNPKYFENVYGIYGVEFGGGQYSYKAYGLYSQSDIWTFYSLLTGLKLEFYNLMAINIKVKYTKRFRRSDENLDILTIPIGISILF